MDEMTEFATLRYNAASATAGAGMLGLIGLAAVCAVFSYFANGLLMPAFQRYALARPNARSSHSVPTPQGGGVAVLLAVLAGLVLFAWTPVSSGVLTPPFLLTGLGALILAVAGAWDDIVNLPVLPRLAAQFGAAVLGVAAVARGEPIAFSGTLTTLLPLAVIGLVWFINLSNFMDGIDGITVAEFVPMCGALAVLASMGALSPAAGALAAALTGALTGFAPHNRHVARLFLGDTGSLAIGFVAGCLLLWLLMAGHPVAALILPLYYLADSTLTLALRLLRGENVTQAHRTHFYQRATDLGWSVPAITRRIALVNLGLAALAIVSVLVPGWPRQALMLIFACGLTVMLLRDLSRAPTL